jgi:hypothetical protein
MKIMNVKSRNYKGKQYHKYRVNLAERLLSGAAFKEGDELYAQAKNGEIRLRRK